MFYIRWAGVSSHVALTTFAGHSQSTADWTLLQLARELAGIDLLVFTYPLRPVAHGFLLKRLLRPRVCFWDYYDDLYYGRETWPKIVLTEIWRRMCDRVLVLSPTLLSRFPNSLHWDNASSLVPMRDVRDTAKTVGTIASLDERFDQISYEILLNALPAFRFHLYGRIHNYRNRDAGNVRLFHAWIAALARFPNFRYFGGYGSDQLQAIVSTFDVGLIPYLPGPRCQHLNPDKYYHYTNAGVPVVSAPIPSLLERENVVFYFDQEELVERVQQMAERSTVAAVRFEWDDRLLEILNMLEGIDERSLAANSAAVR